MIKVLHDKESGIVMHNTDEVSEKNIQDKVFKCILENNIQQLQDLFARYNLKPNFYDNDGMTPLQHACYKGNKEVVEFLIKKGANVNDTQHEYNYSALHFAALSGNSDICLLLMNSGAKSHATNTIGKTASQVAAFIGNHNCVTIINNYVPQLDIDYYTIVRGMETKPKLLPILSVPLYSYIMQINIHPVRVAMKIPKILLDEYPQVSKVLKLMVEREIKKGTESNEVLSFKFHYLEFILSEINTMAITKKETDPIEAFAKRILRGCRGEEYLESLLRDCVREYQYREGLLFQQMVKSLACKEDSPPALNVILSAINSQSNFNEDNNPCVTCSEPRAVKKCSKCKAVQYCNRECQRLHWFMHKKECVRSPAGSVSKDRTSDNEYLKADELSGDTNKLSI